MVSSGQILGILVVRLKCETADIFLLTTDLVSLKQFGYYSLCEILSARRNIILRLKRIFKYYINSQVYLASF